MLRPLLLERSVNIAVSFRLIVIRVDVLFCLAECPYLRGRTRLDLACRAGKDKSRFSRVDGGQHRAVTEALDLIGAPSMGFWIGTQAEDRFTIAGDRVQYASAADTHAGNRRIDLHLSGRS